MDIRLLGTVEAIRDGQTIDIGHARQRAVLAILAADAGTVVSSESLSLRVWGDEGPARHRDTLYVYLSKLRRALPGAVGRHGGGYVFDLDPQTVDLHRFRAIVSSAGSSTDPGRTLGEALELWRGEAFAGLDIPWLTRLSHTLEAERYAAWLDRNDALLEAERYGQLADELERAAAERLGDERLAAQAMLALFHTGRQDAALRCFEATRRHLLENLGNDPGPRLRYTHRRILGGDGGPASPVAVPRQVPPAPSHFTGRGREMSEMDQRTRGDSPILALCGPGGIGKTWLALRWVGANAHRFGGGQIYIDLHGFDPARQPVAPERALRAALGALGVGEASIPSDPEAAAALFRSLTTDRRVLVVLDNANDHLQVAPLLPGVGSATIITSRSNLAGLVAERGAQRIQLSTLDDDEARRALASRLGADRLASDPEATAALIGHCGGLPLALGIVAANAAARPDPPLSVLAADLRDRADRLDGLETDDLSASLRSVFGTSARALSGPARELFALLGLAPSTTVSRDAAASLAGLPRGATRRLLRELEGAHLASRDADGRFRMHDLTYLYAAELAAAMDASAREAAQRRLVDHALHSSFSAARAFSAELTTIGLEPPFADTTVSDVDADAALSWFAAEYPNLLAIQETAVRLGMDGHVWRLAWTIGRYQWVERRWSEAVTVWTRATRASQHDGQPRAKAVAYSGLGRIFTRTGELERAESALTTAIEAADQTDNVQHQMSMRLSLALIDEARERYAAARDRAAEIVEETTRLNESVWRAHALNVLAWCEAHLGRLEDARRHCEESLAIREQTEIIGTMGFIVARQGHHEEALRWHNRYGELLRREGNLTSLAEVFVRIGDSHAKLGAAPEARRAWTEAVELMRSQGRWDEARAVQEKLDAATI